MTHHISEEQESHITPDVTLPCSNPTTDGTELALSGRFDFIFCTTFHVVQTKLNGRRLMKYTCPMHNIRPCYAVNIVSQGLNV